MSNMHSCCDTCMIWDLSFSFQVFPMWLVQLIAPTFGSNPQLGRVKEGLWTAKVIKVWISRFVIKIISFKWLINRKQLRWIQLDKLLLRSKVLCRIILDSFLNPSPPSNKTILWWMPPLCQYVSFNTSFRTIIWNNVVMVRLGIYVCDFEYRI